MTTGEVVDAKTMKYQNFNRKIKAKNIGNLAEILTVS